MSEEKNDHDKLVVKRVVKAQIWLFLDEDLLKALMNNIPVTMTLDEEDNKVVKEAMRTKGSVELCFVRKDK